MPNYNSIYNFTEQRNKITYPWVFWDDAFSDTELQAIVNFCDIEGTGNSSLVGQHDIEKVEEIRISEVKFHNRNEKTDWIFERLNNIIQATNERFYNFDLNGYDMFQYTKYFSDRRGRYDFHTDMIFGEAIHQGNIIETRKLSMTLCLNDDYEGGEFQLNLGMENASVTVPTFKGRAIFFPSFLIHRVTPVTSGIRKSIVVWVTGPKFR